MPQGGAIEGRPKASTSASSSPKYENATMLYARVASMTKWVRGPGSCPQNFGWLISSRFLLVLLNSYQ